MNDRNKKYAIGIAAILALILGGVFAFTKWQVFANEPGKYDEFAKCLGEKGAIFYGAFWCPHCQNQKKLFGSSAKLLPYKECSLPNGSGQNQLCNDAGIKSYPTWVFADGSREAGEVALDKLAEKTACTLPQTQN